MVAYQLVEGEIVKFLGVIHLPAKLGSGVVRVPKPDALEEVENHFREIISPRRINGINFRRCPCRLSTGLTSREIQVKEVAQKA